MTRHMLGAGPRHGPAAIGRRIHRDGRPVAADQQPVVPGLGLPRMPLRLCCERAAELTVDPPPRGQRAPAAAASFVSPESATRAGPASSTDAIAALRGRPFLVNSSPAMEQIHVHRPNSKDIYYPAAEAV
jgi:hypothetical protein